MLNSGMYGGSRWRPVDEPLILLEGVTKASDVNVKQFGAASVTWLSAV